MKKYKELVKIGFKKIIIYKGLITLINIKNLIYIFLQYNLWSAIKENSYYDIDLKNIIVYFLIIQGIRSINYNLSQEMSYDVKNGNIVSILTKPISIEKYYFFDILGNTFAKVITILLLNLIGAMLIINDFSIYFIFQIILLITGSYILNFVIELIFGTFSFFTQSIWGIESLKSILLLLLSGHVFPIIYYPTWLRTIIEYIPFSYIYGNVANFIVYRQGFLKIFILQFIFIIIMYLIYKILLGICLKKLSVNGG